MNLKKEWLIFKLEDEHLLDALDTAINAELIKADLRTYSRTATNYTWKRYHPTKDLVAAPFKIGKTPSWDAHILKHIDKKDLVKLTKDWEAEIE